MTKKQIREKLSIYLDKNDFNIPTFEDMINFAREIATEATKELEVQIKKMKKYLDCDFCEYQNNKEECHQCNYLEKTKWTLKGDKDK